MCCCEKSTRNGEPGYSWDGKNVGIRPLSPPELPGWEIVYDEPGRCGPVVNGKKYDVDHHSHHYRLFKSSSGEYRGLVHHGGGTVEIGMDYEWAKLRLLMDPMDSDSRFILFMAVESIGGKMAEQARESEAHKWRVAATEKRIKTRKQRNSHGVKVWIEPPKATEAEEK